MARELKNLIVKEYLAEYKGSSNFVLLSYQGLNALESIELREKLQNKNVAFKVLKNSLSIIVFKELGVTELIDYVTGQCALATNTGDSIEFVKALVGCLAGYPSLKINGGVFEGKQVSVDEIETLSKIPDRSVLYAQILGGIKSPMVGIVNSINCVLRNLLFCLNEIKEKKQ